MPIYDFKCLDCDKEFEEVFSTISRATAAQNEKTVTCPHCAKCNVEKQISRGTSHVLNGRGWAKDRYGK